MPEFESPPNKSMRRYADWLDTRYRIPGTKITFGLDFILGLIPGAGDVLGILLSGGLVLAMVAKGASARALILMLMNILLDAVIGAIPVLGDLFDLFFKANKRNLDLFQDHFEEGKHRGPAWPVLLVIVVVVCSLLALVTWLFFKVTRILFGYLTI